MKNRLHARWEPHEVERLRELAKSGKTDREIGRELGRSRWSVYTKRRTNKIRTGVTCLTDSAAIRKLLAKHNDQQAAEKLGCSDSAVHRLRKKLGVSPRQPHSRHWTKAELSLLGTAPDAALARQLECSRKHVFEMRKRHGIAKFAGSK